MVDISSKLAVEIEEEQEKDNLKKIEAILFISGRFLSIQEIVTLSDLNAMIVREALSRLKDKYDKFDSAIEIVEKNNSWKMDVVSEYSNIINKLATGDAEFSKSEQETLAIIAYKQPIKQSVIIKIRGNKSYDHIKKFEELNLIKRKKEGHTHILTLSEEFYDYFNVKNEKEPFNEKNLEEEDTDEDEEVEVASSQEVVVEEK